MRSRLGIKTRLAMYVLGTGAFLFLLMNLEPAPPQPTPVPVAAAAPAQPQPAAEPAPAEPAAQPAPAKGLTPLVQLPPSPLPVPEPAQKPAPEQTPAPAPAAEPKPEPVPEPKEAPEPAPQPEAEPAPIQPADPEPQPDPVPEPQPDTPAEPAPEPEAEPAQPDESGAIVSEPDQAALAPLPAAPNLHVLGEGMYWIDTPQNLEEELRPVLEEAGMLIFLSPTPGPVPAPMEYLRTETIAADVSDLTREAAEHFLYLCENAARRPVVAAALPGARGAAYFQGIYLLARREMPLDAVLTELEPALAQAGSARDAIVSSLRAWTNAPAE